MNLIQDRTGGASQHKKVGKKTRRKQKDLFGQSMSSKHL
jgi:hypothetical protein